jgi:hypothetical protein
LLKSKHLMFSMISLKDAVNAEQSLIGFAKSLERLLVVIANQRTNLFL